VCDNVARKFEHFLLNKQQYRLVSFRVADQNAQAEFISAEHETVSFERALREERICFFTQPTRWLTKRSELTIEYHAQAEFISAEHETVSFERALREERTCFITQHLDEQ